MIVTSTTFALYTLLGNELTAARAFTCLSIVHILEFPLAAMPMSIQFFFSFNANLKIKF